MTTSTPKQRRGALVLLAVVAVAAIAVALVVVLGGDDGDRERKAGGEPRVLAGPAATPFALSYPASWEVLPPARLRAGDPRPVAGLRRRDGRGVLTITVRGPIRGGIRSLVRSLPRELAARFEDFRLVRSRLVDVAAGPALSVTWVRERSGRAQSTLVVPEGNRRSFALDTVLPAGARDAAREAGAIQRSFDLPGRP